MISQFKEKEQLHQRALEDARRAREIQEIALMHRNTKRNRHHESYSSYSSSSSSISSSDSIENLKEGNYSNDEFDSISDFEAPNQSQKLLEDSFINYELEQNTTKEFDIESKISEDVFIEENASRVTISGYDSAVPTNDHHEFSVCHTINSSS